MKKKATPRRDGLAPLVAEVRGLIQSARRGAASVVNTLQVMTNFEIGRRIVEHEQQGKKRAGYGAELVKELSARLTMEFGPGFSERSLEYMRKFFVEFSPRIPQTPSGELLARRIPQTLSAKLAPGRISERASRKSPFTLSWSHYVLLLTIKDADERSFYEIESANEHWSLSELKAARRERHHRPVAVQGQERRRREAYPAQGRQYPRQGIPALPAVEGTAESQAH